MKFTLALGLALAAGAWFPAAPAAESRLAAPATLPAGEAAAVRLRRALQELAGRDSAAALRELEAVDLASWGLPGAPSELDRVAFVRGWLYRRRGDDAAFAALLRGHSIDPSSPSPLRRWLAGQESWTALAAASDPAEALTHAQALAVDSADQGILLYLRGLVAEAAGEPAERYWGVLTRRPDPAWDRDLVAAAALRGAAGALARGDDAGAWLDRIPAESRWSGRVAWLRALADSAGVAASPAAGARTEAPEPTELAARFVAAAAALDNGDYAGAARLHADLDREHAAASRRLDALAAPDGVDAAWTDWDSTGMAGTRLVLDPRRPIVAAEPLVAAALDPAGELPERVGALSISGALVRTTGATALLRPPSRETLDRLAAVERAASRRATERVHLDEELERERADGARRIRFAARGEARLAAARAEADSLAIALDALRARHAVVAAALPGLADAFGHELAARAARLTARRDALALRSDRLHRLGFEGPVARRSPADSTAAAVGLSLLRRNQALALALEQATGDRAARLPELIRDSWSERWEPSLAARLAGLDARAADDRRRREALAERLAETRDAVAASPVVAALEAARRAARDDEARLRSARVAGRAEAVAVAVAAARADLVPLREGIDYGLALTAYAEARQLAAADSVGPRAPASPEAAAAEGAARARLERFLADHPASAARGAVRYWLADLELAAARAGAGPADYGSALALFEAILAEDPDYPHRDAVLYHVGMIRAERGEPEAAAPLETLVTDYPGSPYAQEAALHLAEEALATRNLERAVPLLEQAAGGAATGLRLTALYRLGWAHSAADDHAAAAVAFRRILDDGAGPDPRRLKSDLRGEATTGLVQCLARAGGAPAFRATFDDGVARPFAAEVLERLALLLHEASLFRESIACDELYLERHAMTPGALDAAQRIVAAWESWHRPGEALAAREVLAPRFVPDGAWARTQAADSLREVGAAFARVALADAAIGYHRRARAENDPAGWSRAAGLYAAWLRLWPRDPAAPRLLLYSGEVAAARGRPDEALGFFGAAAAADTGSWGTEALWQRAQLRLERGAAAGAAADFAAYRGRGAAARDRRLPALDAEIDAWHAADLPGPAAARLLERVALAPGDPGAPARAYRAGVDFAAVPDVAAAEDAWRLLISEYPGHELVAESRLRIAAARLAAGDSVAAARTYREFALGAPKDPRAPDALLQSLDLCAAAGDSTGADQVRLDYAARYPDDDITLLRLLEPLARRQLDRLGAVPPLAALQPAGKGKKASDPLQRWITLARARPKAASAELLARIEFLKGEIVAAECRTLRLSQPLEPAIRRKKARMSEALAAYARVGPLGQARWAHAAAFRSGELVAEFGTALQESERPSGLAGDDLAAYDAVVDRQARGFFDRAEKSWSDLLATSSADAGDPGGWIARTQQTLWPRLADRFYFRPEAELPPPGAAEARAMAEISFPAEANVPGSADASDTERSPR